MDKGTPHTRLVEVFALLDAGKIQITFSALAGAAALGLDSSGIVQVVRALTTKDFHKSIDDLRRPHRLARRLPAQHGSG